MLDFLKHEKYQLFNYCIKFILEGKANLNVFLYRPVHPNVEFSYLQGVHIGVDRSVEWMLCTLMGDPWIFDFWKSPDLQDTPMVHPLVLRSTPNLRISFVFAPPLMDVENVPNAASEIIKRASGRGLSSFLIVCLKGVSSLHFRKLLSICVVYLTNSRTWKQLQRLFWTSSQSVFCQTNI